MTKLADDTVIDGAFAIVDNATIMTVCSAAPNSRAEAVTTYALADVAPTFTGPDNGTPSGRKISVDQKANVPIDNDGNATHIALCDGSNLLYVTTCTPQALVAGGTVTIPAWTITILDPT
jgi:hypothetical protein